MNVFEMLLLVGANAFMRKLVIRDQTGFISLTLWKEAAEKDAAKLEGNSVIAGMNAQVSEFRGNLFLFTLSLHLLTPPQTPPVSHREFGPITPVILVNWLGLHVPVSCTQSYFFPSFPLNFRTKTRFENACSKI